MLTFVGVMNLLFSLACGCTTGFWAMTWSAAATDPAELAAQIDKNEAKIKVQVSEIFEQDKELRNNPKARAIVERLLDKENLKAVAVTVADHPHTKTMRTASLVSAMALAVLLVASILLLLRKNAGRVLSMLALLAFIAGTITTMLKFSGIGDALGDQVATRLAAMSEFKDLPAEDQRKIERTAEGLPMAASALVMGASVVSIAWPIVSLLILFASRSIKEACVPTYPRM
jgi:hypothetical protein